MVAFFIAMLAFEVARESAVVAANAPIVGSGVFVSGSAELGYADAKGQWIRSDEGSPIVPTSVAIRCSRDSNTCIEATTTTFGTAKTMSTEIDVFEQPDFTKDAVTYTNDLPTCATYRVRIDFVQERVTATRTRKTSPTDPRCAGMEERITMELKDGFEAIHGAPWMDGYFLPIFNSLRAFNR